MNQLEKVNDLDSSALLKESQQNGLPGNSDEFAVKWGFPLEELYKLALRFYKGKQSNCLRRHSSNFRSLHLWIAACFSAFPFDISLIL